MDEARQYYQRAYKAALRQGPAAAGEANSLRLQIATSVVPPIYNSTSHMATVRTKSVLGILTTR
jgi:hypothetical protein